MGSEGPREASAPDSKAESPRRQLRDQPLEESQKSYHTVLEQQIADAEKELKRPATSLLLSGLTAGLDLGFGPFAMAAVLTLTRDALVKPATDLLVAFAYTTGFIFVVLGRSALFTEHTTSAILPALARRAPVTAVLRLWLLVLVGNLAGGALFAAFAVELGPALHVVDATAFAEIARPMLDKPAGITLMSAMGAGWIMGLLSWLVVSARDTMAQIVIVWWTTMLIAVLKLHHSIAGTVEVLLALFAGSGATGGEFVRFLALAVIGNAVGGVTFVAVLKFAHIRQAAAGRD